MAHLRASVTNFKSAVKEVEPDPKDWTGRNNTSHRTDGHGKFISVSLIGCIELMDISFRVDVNYGRYGRKYRERLRSHSTPGPGLSGP